MGAAIAEAFAAAGATVRLLDLDLDGASARASSLRDRGFLVDAARVDVTASASVDAAVAEALAVHGRIDTLCNNAGIADGLKTVDEVDEATWDRIFAVNVRGPFLMTRVRECTFDRGSPLSTTGWATTSALDARRRRLHHDGPRSVRAA